MLTHNALIAQLRPLLHPMLVHFPIALLFASVALDWLGYWLKHPNLTRAGFYTLALGAFAAGIAALSGPDHATGDPSVPALLAAHQTWASVTVGLAVVLFAARFLSAHGLSGSGAVLYLVATLALLVAVSLTGYFGGEMSYHHAVGVTFNGVSVAGTDGDASAVSAVQPLIPAKPFVALLGFLCIVGFCVWIGLGRRLVPTYYPTWWRAVRQELANAGAPLWTLQRGRGREDVAAPRLEHHVQPSTSPASAASPGLPARMQTEHQWGYGPNRPAYDPHDVQDSHEAQSRPSPTRR